MEVSFEHIEDAIVRKRVEKAAAAFAASGRDAETLARKWLAEKSEATLYDFKQHFGWTEGKAQGVLKRLQRAGIVRFSRAGESNGRLKKFYRLSTLDELEGQKAHPILALR